MTAFENSLRHSFGIEDADDLKYITSLFEPKLLKKGEVFLEEGRSCDKLCFVQSGFLRIFTETEDKQITQWIAPQGYFVTDLSGFIFEKMSRWTIEALTDTRLFYIHKREYKKINTTIPQWPELERQFIVHCFTTLEDRIFSHLSMTAEQRYHFFFQHNKELFHQVPLQYIASMLGMTPETFSRIRKNNK